MLIFITAILGVYYAKYEGLNTLKAGFTQLSKKETPAYEVISGAAIAFAATESVCDFQITLKPSHSNNLLIKMASAASTETA